MELLKEMETKDEKPQPIISTLCLDIVTCWHWVEIQEGLFDRVYFEVEREKMSKPTIAIDFDGVMNTYYGWKGDDELFEPRKGLKEFLAELYSDYRIVIHSTRPAEKIEAWLIKHELGLLVDKVTSYKPVAMAYIDDRSIRFEGNFKDTLSFIKSDKIKTFWELEKEGKDDQEVS